MNERFEPDIKERIATIADNGKGGTIELNLVSYNGHPAKIDLRKWYKGQAQRGIGLTEAEAGILLAALQKYLNKGG